MFHYSKISHHRLSSCHIDLQTLFIEVLKYYDHSILCGFRGEKKQEQAFDSGRSTVHYPFGVHNKKPSMGADVAPYPIKWDNTKRFYHFAGFVEGVAKRLLREGKISHKIRWGGNWNGNADLDDQRFMDLSHFELVL